MLLRSDATYECGLNINKEELEIVSDHSVWHIKQFSHTGYKRNDALPGSRRRPFSLTEDQEQQFADLSLGTARRDPVVRFLNKASSLLREKNII
jgi:hypothetical protein